MTVERDTRTDRQEYFKFLLALVLRTAARDNSFETRKHSSSMRTARLSTIASGVCVCVQPGSGGVCPGVCVCVCVCVCRVCVCVQGSACVSRWGVCTPSPTDPEAHPPGTRTLRHTLCGQKEWHTPVKHYLPVTTVAGVNNTTPYSQ